MSQKNRDQIQAQTIFHFRNKPAVDSKWILKYIFLDYFKTTLFLSIHSYLVAFIQCFIYTEVWLCYSVNAYIYVQKMLIWDLI